LNGDDELAGIAATADVQTDSSDQESSIDSEPPTIEPQLPAPQLQPIENFDNRRY